MASGKEIANRYVAIGEEKVHYSIFNLLVLGIIAGFFISAAGAASTASTAVTDSDSSIYRLISACVFPAGLSMVVIAGSELFTGNCLMLIPVLEKRVSPLQMIRNLVVVYIGNYVGSIAFVIMCVCGDVYGMYDGAFAQSVVDIAVSKTSMTFEEAFFKGILCNILVCIAIWMTIASKHVAEKVITLFFPILLFVLLGFEHSVANMSYIAGGLFAKEFYNIEAATLTWNSFMIGNLLPVTIGNVIGGFLVAVAYWSVYLRKSRGNRGTIRNKN